MKLDYVNAKMGSLNEIRFSNGNVYPISSRPFGMANFTLQTNGEAGNWFYNPTHHTFEGIRLSHQPSPWIGDFGHILFLPYTDELSDIKEFRWSSIRPEKTEIHPHYVSAYLNRYRVKFSLTPSIRGGIIKLENYSDKDLGFAICPFKDSVFTLEGNTIKGYTDVNLQHNAKGNIKEYFYIEFSTIPKSYSKIENGGIKLTFSSDVEIKIALSFISYEQAELNFKRELLDYGYDMLLKETTDIWEEKLNKIQVSGEEKRVKTFYSCMYRAYLYPNTFYELDRDQKPIHYNLDTDKIEQGVFYTNNGFWDTYRTVYSFFSILEPNMTKDFANGFLNYADDTGWLPKWLSSCEIGIMPGTLVESVISELAVKGIIKGEMLKKAYKYLIKNAYEYAGIESRHGRANLNEYIQNGYIASDKHESINHTCDCAYGDYCIAQVAKLVGDEDEYKKLSHRSMNYKNLFDDKEKFLRARNVNGQFRDYFDPYEWGGDNCEGSSWQNGFSVFHDIEGFSKLLGGNKALEKRLDELFSAEEKFSVGKYQMEIHEMSEMACVSFGQMAISNQPSFHIPWLYTLCGNREKAEYWVEKLVDEAFSPDFNGYPGDDDNGTTSCWYLFACLGFYPVCPTSGEYVCTKPLLNIEINGKKIERFNKDKVTYDEIINMLK